MTKTVSALLRDSKSQLRYPIKPLLEKGEEKEVEKAKEADKPEGGVEKAYEEGKPTIQDVEYNHESADNEKEKKKNKKGRRR